MADKLAPAVGRLLAEALTDADPDPAALELFAFDRFVRGQRADGRYGGHKILG